MGQGRIAYDMRQGARGGDDGQGSRKGEGLGVGFFFNFEKYTFTTLSLAKPI